VESTTRQQRGYHCQVVGGSEGIGEQSYSREVGSILDRTMGGDQTT